MLESGSFDAHKNTTVPIIAMLDYLKIDIEISDTGMETTESNDCRECYELKLKELSNRTTLVLSNTRELDRVPNTK